MLNKTPAILQDEKFFLLLTIQNCMHFCSHVPTENPISIHIAKEKHGKRKEINREKNCTGSI